MAASIQNGRYAVVRRPGHGLQGEVFVVSVHSSYRAALATCFRGGHFVASKMVVFHASGFSEGEWLLDEFAASLNVRRVVRCANCCEEMSFREGKVCGACAARTAEVAA